MGTEEKESHGHYFLVPGRLGTRRVFGDEAPGLFLRNPRASVFAAITVIRVFLVSPQNGEARKHLAARGTLTLREVNTLPGVKQCLREP